MAKILAVDDVADNIDLLRYILEKQGHEVLAAHSGREALAIAEKEEVDLVLLDIMMPEMDGLETASRFKSMERLRHVPIIFLTAHRKEAADVARGLAAGGDEYLTKPFERVELLARVNSMLRIKFLYDQVSDARREMERELKTAQAVQSAMLPSRFPYPDRVRFHARYMATSSIGGDYYDVLDYGGGRLGMIVADVSGHGPSAALIVSMLKTILHAGDFTGAEPENVARRLNSHLKRMIPEERFVSLFFGVLDLDAASLTYVRAGHPFPLLLRARDRSVVRLSAAGELVGLFDEIEIEQETTSIGPGDRILMYSDGLIEMVDGAGELYGLRRMERLVKEIFDEGGEALLDAILADTGSFSAEEAPPDDIAVLMAEITGR